MVRQKNSFLLIRVHSGPEGKQVSLKPMDIAARIKSAMEELLGDFGVGKLATMQVRKTSTPLGLFILRVSKEIVLQVRAAMNFVSKLDGNPVILECLHVAGSPRTLSAMAEKLLASAPSDAHDEAAAFLKGLAQF